MKCEKKHKQERKHKKMNITCTSFKLYCEIPLSFILLPTTDDYIHNVVMGEKIKSDERNE